MTLVLGTFLVVILLGAPIAVGMLTASVAYILIEGVPLAILTQRLTQSLNSFPLLAIPLFLLAGRILNEAGITERIFRFANNLVGSLRGGLGHVNVLASMIFAGMSGVAVADIGGLGQVEVRAMNRAGYPRRFTAGITAASAIIGPVIPPSIPLILYSVAGETSMLALFAAGIIPGILIAVVLMISVYVYARVKDLPVETPVAPKELATSFFAALPALFAPVLLIGGMLSGIFSPTEAAAVTVLYALILALVFYRDIGIRDLPRLFLDVVPMVANLSFIIASGMLFAWVLVIEQVPLTIVEFMTGFTGSSWLLLTIIVPAFLVIGLFVEASIVFIVVAPMLLPTVTAAGIDEIHFGIITVIAMGIGMFTPPMGIALFMLKDLCGITFNEAAKSVLPFLAALLMILAVITYVPDISLFLPRQLGLTH
ncbi:TRAP transporter large permease [Acuticoccus sp. M5D2P5]|uniref:TRAP transporter large permease n=1 Tax=Acuticoccus kalidii TaxID=2910977 RepID=UPI001F1DD850|nr:TRAP transporter large permease [Acuticoccus kalidii]MCF3933719.1 TRAP transporter large permease [Acuticoccus kalidii]